MIRSMEVKAIVFCKQNVYQAVKKIVNKGQDKEQAGATELCSSDYLKLNFRELCVCFSMLDNDWLNFYLFSLL